ncbi:hypothetical protein OOT46_17905 [Aquabacterium sp. A7-Y]|uniref:hypothetical protein n=1 Tax=Aquabacterium sp. A7-Y TaxID=1349605 RepID=UPI00223DABC4|nr:hypothetical protein [Aquabacterium sp. A7-Y]MCW7539716.1 hypothetical protein [Aquabacterium sp. A7-Y]
MLSSYQTHKQAARVESQTLWGLPRRLLCQVLLYTGDALLRAAESLQPVRQAAQARACDADSPMEEPRVEFHAEPGACDGALYVDGEYIGRLPGVRRL